MDLERITEVIVHLLDNAGKYSPPETPIHVTAELRGSEVVTSVADHGPGVDDMEQQMIFEKILSWPRPTHDHPRHRNGLGNRQGNRRIAWRKNRSYEPARSRITLLFFSASDLIRVASGLLEAVSIRMILCPTHCSFRAQ